MKKNQPDLFAEPLLPYQSPRAEWLKRHAFVTHRCAIEVRSARWLALQPYSSDKGKDAATIMAESCRLYEEANLIGYGATEAEAVDNCARLNETPLWNEEPFALELAAKKLRAKLDALTPETKEWLRDACHGAADVEEIPWMSKPAAEECLTAGLIERDSPRSKSYQIPGEVMDLVYSKDYFRQPPTA